jgi:hypothetical protein
MTSRTYTVHELEDLRRVMENKYLFGTYGLTRHGGMSRSYMEADKVKAVEEMVRTAILAGHTAEDYRLSETSADDSGYTQYTGYRP